MPECKTCGKKFHACSNCCFTYNWEYKYCTKECWLASPEYQQAKEIYLKVKNLVPEKIFDEFIDKIAFNDDYWGELNSWK